MQDAEESKINNIGDLLSRNSKSRCGHCLITKDAAGGGTTQLLEWDIYPLVENMMGTLGTS